MAVSQRCCIIIGIAVVIAAVIAVITGVVVFFLVRDNHCDDGSNNIPKEYDG